MESHFFLIFIMFFNCLIATRDLKDLEVTRVRVGKVVREDRRDTGVSLVCRVYLDLR